MTVYRRRCLQWSPGKSFVIFPYLLVLQMLKKPLFLCTKIYIYLHIFSQVYKEKTQDHDSMFRLKQISCNYFRVYKPFSVLCETSILGANFKLFYLQEKYPDYSEMHFNVKMLCQCLLNFVLEFYIVLSNSCRLHQ